MSDLQPADDAVLDCPEVSAVVFHPRPDTGEPQPNDHLITVAPGLRIGVRFHVQVPEGANILFFHGNGEIAADYDQLGPIYNQMGINFCAADYRGYGHSNGHPTVSALLADSHVIMQYTRDWLQSNGFPGPLLIMGRSLGSAAALELCAHHAQAVDGLIIESGFALAAPLLRLLGANPQRIGFKEERGFQNSAKIRRYAGPTLIIHAEHDHIIPFSDGQALFDASPAQYKQLIKIKGADHNDILPRGFAAYMQAVQELVHAALAQSSPS